MGWVSVTVTGPAVFASPLLVQIGSQLAEARSSVPCTV